MTRTIVATTAKHDHLGLGKVLLLAVSMVAACAACVTWDVCAVPGRNCQAPPHAQPAQPKTQEPQPTPERVVSVPAACDGVADDLLYVQHGWTIRVLPSTQALPMPEVSDAYFYAIDGLERAMPDEDQLDRDMFYLHAHHDSLRRLSVLYPKLDPGLLREAKLDACRHALAGGTR